MTGSKYVSTMPLTALNTDDHDIVKKIEDIRSVSKIIAGKCRNINNRKSLIHKNKFKASEVKI